MKNSNYFKRGLTSVILLVIFIVVGMEIFQGQRVQLPVNEKIFDYDENDPLIDRPTREALSHVVESDGGDLDIITDANGFDNFEIGVDFAEQMLVSNPRNPLQMHFGVNNSATGQNAYYTINGHDWTQSNPAYHSSICCDPWSAWDSLGTLFYGSGVQGQYIYKSTNAGQTYGPPVLSVTGNDRNTIAADQTNGPFKNYLYAAITPGNFARSTNNGTSWTQTFTSSNAIPGVMIAVGPNGATQGGCVIYVTNTGLTQNVTYNFHRSTNGGANFTANVSNLTVAGYVGTLNSAGRLVINNGRTRPYPMIAMDNSYGPNRGRLYLVYASNVPAGNGQKPDIILQYSTNMGTSWSSKITVNDVTTGDQWFPAIWCEKETGRLYIKWYDTRENPATYAVNVYATYTDNGGTSFAPNQKLTTQSWTYPSPSCPANTNCYRGDYDGCTANQKTSFSVWYDGRLGTYKNVGSYFPDFGMLATPAGNSIHQTNSAVNYTINIPAVKLYTDTVTFSASISPAPATGSFAFDFLGGNTLTTYPNTKIVKVRTVGTVTPTGNYTVTITGQGPNGTPVHKRNVTLTVNTTIGATICEDFTGTKFPPASMYQEFSGTEYWSRSTVSAYGIGSGSAKFNFFNAPAGTVQSLASNNFANTVANTFLTFDNAYAPYTSFGPDTLVVESSTNFGATYNILATLLGKVDGTGELNTAPPNVNPFTPVASEWRPKIYSLPTGTNKVRLTAKSGFGNNLYIDNVCVQVLSSPVTNTVSYFPEGFYRATASTIPDTVTIYLHRADFPNIGVDSAKLPFNSNAIAFPQFMRALSGTYYFVLKHRNSIDLWSRSGGEAYTRGNALIMDFVNNVSLSFNSYMALVDNQYYGAYGGDILRDGFVDLSDINAIFNDANLFLTGYVITDVTGDDFVDLTDIVIAYNNAQDFVSVQKPPGAAPQPVLSDLPEPIVFENDIMKQKYEQGLSKQNQLRAQMKKQQEELESKTKIFESGRLKKNNSNTKKSNPVNTDRKNNKLGL